MRTYAKHSRRCQLVARIEKVTQSHLHVFPGHKQPDDAPSSGTVSAIWTVPISLLGAFSETLTILPGRRAAIITRLARLAAESLRDGRRLHPTAVLLEGPGADALYSSDAFDGGERTSVFAISDDPSGQFLTDPIQ